MNFEVFTQRLGEGGWIPTLLVVILTFLFTFLAKIFSSHAQKLILNWTKRTRVDWDDAVYHLLSKTRIIFIGIWIFYLLTQAFHLDPRIISVAKTLTVIISSYQLAIWAIHAIRLWRDRKLQHVVAADESAKAPLSLITSVVEALAVIIIILMALSNLGVDIGALIAGLGIGGIAVALAAQNILGDLFASFSIIFDKPFLTGDYIQAGNDAGTVENIGLKTTRVKSLTGEQLIFANKDLLDSRIRNFKRMLERRVGLKLRISYETPVEKLRQIPQWTQEIIAKQNQARFDYCRFVEIGEYAHIFEIVFWMSTPDGSVYLQTQENFYLEFLAKLASEKVHLAVPTRTIYLTDPLSLAQAPS